MGTKINYVDKTWNPVCGCTKCSPGCDNCYAEKMAYRLSAMGIPYYDMVQDEGSWNGNIELVKEALDKPLHWREPRRILVPSMGDLFHEKVPFQFLYEILRRINSCPQHSFFLLTKRPKRMLSFSKVLGPGGYHSAPPMKWPDNAHLGGTICNQEEADEKIPILLQIPAAHRWLSIEPMLGEIDLDRVIDVQGGRYLNYLRGDWYDVIGKDDNGQAMFSDRPSGTFGHGRGIDWVVVGCEKIGQKPGRECKPEWIKSIVDQCKAAGVKCFVKQMEVGGKVVHDLAKMPVWAVQQEI